MLSMVYMFIFGAFGTLIATFLGGFFSKLISNKRKEIFNFFQNFSVGGIIALLFFELIIEAIEHYQTGINNDALGALYIVYRTIMSMTIMMMRNVWITLILQKYSKKNHYY